jgi:mono/diheme cytochrome c family protein
VPTGEWEVFADGFAGVDPIVSVSDALYRPMGIAMGPDGSLYLGDTEQGKIWRVMYKGDKAHFGNIHLAKMEGYKKLSHIRTPDEVEDNLQRGQLSNGASLYYSYCAICHQQNGRGASGRFPPLAGTPWVNGDKERLIGIVLNGLEGPIEVKGETYNNVMPQHSFLSDQEIALILTYIRQSFGNTSSAVEPDEVRIVRDKLRDAL